MFRESESFRNVPIEPVEGGFQGIKRISWGAIIAGVIVALVFQMLFSLLGIGIGMSAIDPQEANPFAGLGLGAMIWWFATILISLFAGGWVTSRMAGFSLITDSLLHGLLTWSVFTLLSVYLITTAIGTAVSGVSGALSKSLNMIKGSPMGDQLKAEAQKQGVDLNNIKQEAQEGKAKLEQNKANIEQQAREKADKAVSAGSKAGIFGFIAMLLGAVAAGLGGIAGRREAIKVETPMHAPVYK